MPSYPPSYPTSDMLGFFSGAQAPRQASQAHPLCFLPSNYQKTDLVYWGPLASGDVGEVCGGPARGVIFSDEKLPAGDDGGHLEVIALTRKGSIICKGKHWLQTVHMTPLFRGLFFARRFWMINGIGLTRIRYGVQRPSLIHL